MMFFSFATKQKKKGYEWLLWIDQGIGIREDLRIYVPLRLERQMFISLTPSQALFIPTRQFVTDRGDFPQVCENEREDH